MAGATVVATIVAASLAFAVPGSPPEVIDVLEPDPIVVGEGNGWGVHPDQTAGGSTRLVEGPGTPPLGRGSMEFIVTEIPDRALAFTVPNGQPAPALPTPSPWADLSASYSTYTFPIGNPSANLPTLRFVGFQSIVPVPTGFTTLSFAPPSAEVVSGAWQTWEIGPDSMVFQSNPDDGFCVQTTPCTLAEFAAQYPLGGWGQVQLGIGTGAPAGSQGYADAVVVHDGPDSEFSYDFEIPADQNSTASIAPGAATATGGSAVVTLTASPLATDGLFTVTLTLPDGTVQTEEVTVPAGGTLPLELAVPFGTSTVEVTAQGVVIASGPVVFEPAGPPGPPEPPAPPAAAGGGGATLPPTGADAAWPAITATLLAAAGIGTFWFARRRAVRARAARG